MVGSEYIMLQRLWISGEGRTKLMCSQEATKTQSAAMHLLMTEAAWDTEKKQAGEGKNRAKHRTAGGM